MLPKSHFYIRTKRDSDPRNLGAHPRGAIKITDGKAFVAFCSNEDTFRRVTARDLLLQRVALNVSIPLTPQDTIHTILKRAGVTSKRQRDLDLDRAAIAFERSIEA